MKLALLLGVTYILEIIQVYYNMEELKTNAKFLLYWGNEIV